MSKLWKRLSSEEFQILFDQGCFVSGKILSLCVLSNQSYPLVGFTMKKAKRTSVQRNYLKRKLREAFMLIQFFLPTDWHLVVIGNDAVVSLPVERISEEIIALSDLYKRKHLENTVKISH